MSFTVFSYKPTQPNPTHRWTQPMSISGLGHSKNVNDDDDDEGPSHGHGKHAANDVNNYYRPNCAIAQTCITPPP